MIATGTTLTLDVQGATGQWLPRTADEVRADVLNTLSGLFAVFDLSLTRNTFLSDPENLYYWNWGYKGVVTLTTREAYGSANDVGAIVANAFYTAAGSVPTVTVRGSGPQQGAATTYVGADLQTWLVLAAVAGVAALAFLYVPRR